MKDFVPVSPEHALAHRTGYQRIIDVRSPSEYADDCFPGARGHCVLNDAERVQIGTLNKEVSPFEAKRVGAAIVARNISVLLENELHTLNRQGKILVYCWRGGNRSASLATILARIGYSVEVIEGGYKAYRREMIRQLALMAPKLNYRVVVGRTGSGKSLILQQMRAQGAQVLDLEELARHKGSVLGLSPGDVQPSQKKFDSLLWEQLQSFTPERPVYLESESKKIGQCQVPDALIESMRASPCIDIQADLASRVGLLKHQYAHFLNRDSNLHDRLDALVPLHGHTKIQAWKDKARQGLWEEFVADLLNEHYDPAYDKSIRRNFKRFENASRVQLSLDPTLPTGQALMQTIAQAAIQVLAAG